MILQSLQVQAGKIDELTHFSVSYIPTLYILASTKELHSFNFIFLLFSIIYKFSKFAIINWVRGPFVNRYSSANAMLIK